MPVTPSARQVSTVAQAMFEEVHDGRSWKGLSIDQQRIWINAARAALRKAGVHG